MALGDGTATEIVDFSNAKIDSTSIPREGPELAVIYWLPLLFYPRDKTLTRALRFEDAAPASMCKPIHKTPEDPEALRTKEFEELTLDLRDKYLPQIFQEAKFRCTVCSESLIEGKPRVNEQGLKEVNFKDGTKLFEVSYNQLNPILEEDHKGYIISGVVAPVCSWECMGEIEKVWVGLREEQKEGKCGCCGKVAKLRCSKCKSVWYCSRNCQVTGWKSGHSKECKKLRATREAYNA